MQQYFIEQVGELHQMVTFTHQQQHHIMHVLRMKSKTKVRIVDGIGKVFLAEIAYSNQQPVAFLIEEFVQKPLREVVLVAALIKKEKWEFLLQKAAELGVTKIIPLQTNRTVVKATDEKTDRKLARWNKIVLEACEQSHQAICTKVMEPIRLKQLGEYLVDVNVVAYEKENVSRHIRHYVEKESRVLVVIGPEGGFEPNEIEQMIAMGIQPCSLGKNILRAETAAIYALSVIDALSEENV